MVIFKEETIHRFKIIKELYLFIKHFSLLIGYAVLAVATTHGVYFLIKGSRHIILDIQWYIFSFNLDSIRSCRNLFYNNANTENKLKMYRNIHQIDCDSIWNRITYSFDRIGGSIVATYTNY